MRNLIFIIFTIAAINSYAERIEVLVDKNVQLTPFNIVSKYVKQHDYRPIVYHYRALEKGDFSKKHLHPNQDIFGITLYIKETRVVNEGKKNESIAIIAQRNNEEIVIHIPLKYNIKEKPLSSLWITKSETESGFINIYEHANKRFIDIPFYNADLIDSLNSIYRGKIVYPMKHCNHIENKLSSHWYYQRNNIIAGHPYIFDGFSYSMPSGSTIYLTADLRDKHGNVFYLPIEREEIYNSHDNQYINTPSLEHFSEFIWTEDSLLKTLGSLYKQHEDSLSGLIGKEVFLQKNDIKGYSITQKRSIHDFNKSDFYQLTDILIMPSINREFPYFEKFALLSKNNNLFAYPINSNSISHIQDGKQRHEEERIAEEDFQKKQAERERMEAAEDEKYYKSIVGKFGRANANLIIDGRVKLGFTKAMCEEAWGTPHDKTRVTTQFGTAEAWWYGDGSILYFQGNKLVIIQE